MRDDLDPSKRWKISSQRVIEGHSDGVPASYVNRRRSLASSLRWVALLEIVARILHRERSIVLRNQFQTISFGIMNVRDQVLGAVVLLIRIHGVVKLPEVSCAWRIFHRLPRFGTAALMRAIVHDGD